MLCFMFVDFLSFAVCEENQNRHKSDGTRRFKNSSVLFAPCLSPVLDPNELLYLFVFIARAACYAYILHCVCRPMHRCFYTYYYVLANTPTVLVVA